MEIVDHHNIEQVSSPTDSSTDIVYPKFFPFLRREPSLVKAARKDLQQQQHRVKTYNNNISRDVLSTFVNFRS
jgi:hypothetical protein